MTSSPKTTSDVVVEPAAASHRRHRKPAPPRSPHALVHDVENVEGVSKAAGTVLVNGLQIIGSDGEPVASGGAPNFGSNWSDDEDLAPYRLTEGRGPTAAVKSPLTRSRQKSGELSSATRLTRYPRYASVEARARRAFSGSEPVATSLARQSLPSRQSKRRPSCSMARTRSPRSML